MSARTPTWLRAHGLALLAIGGLVSAAAAQELPPNKATCAEAYESAQESRASGELQETRSKLAYCAQAECPAFVQRDCARWLQEVDRELPSIVVAVVGLEPEHAASARLKIDGQPAPEALAGRAVILDPGKHELLLERTGQAPLVRTIMAQQGVQNRSVQLVVAGTGASSAGVRPFEEDAVPASSGPLRAGAYAAWGVGALGLGTFAVLGTLARADERGLREDCPRVAVTPEVVGDGVCPSERVQERKDTYEREQVLADVGLVAGVVGVVAGTVLFLLSNGDASSSSAGASASAALRVDVQPGLGGAQASLSGQF